jgi:hypothetical protein
MLEFEKLKNDVLLWLDSLKVPESCCRYKFTAYADDTIFCTCFALFILDLFRETEKFSQQEKQDWISHIQSFQNKEHGCFEPAKYYHKDKERNRYQLTCFCLSALGILGVEPKLPLKFIEQWKTHDDVEQYLYDRGCQEGKPGSGNAAMFLAIFLTYEYERTKDSSLLDKINTWFEFHNKTQNRNGLWGPDRKSHYLHGLQNGFHQLVVYFYWQREIPGFNRIIDIALVSQDRQGFFASTPGGESCHDYDLVHILVTAHRITDYRKEEIEACLSKTFDAILSVRNNDGGFCRSKCRLTRPTDFFRYIPVYFSKSPSYLWYYRARSSLGTLLKRKHLIYTGWTEKSRSWTDSNLWDSWFRCLALAEIAHVIDDKSLEDFRNVNFHKIPGLGYFPK